MRAAASGAAPALRKRRAAGAAAERRCHLSGDVVVGGDARERYEVHHPLLSLPAHDVGEPGLAEATGPDDRRDAGGTQQAGHRGDVVGPGRGAGWARARPRAGRQASRPAAAAGAAPAGQRRDRCRAVAQGPAVGVVPGQRSSRARGGRLAAQQLEQHLLVTRALAGQLGERLDRLGPPSQPRQRERPRPHQRPSAPVRARPAASPAGRRTPLRLPRRRPTGRVPTRRAQARPSSRPRGSRPRSPRPPAARRRRRPGPAASASRYPVGVLAMTSGPSCARTRDTSTCRAFVGFSGCSSGHSPATRRDVLHPVRRSSARRASRLRSRGPVIS